MKNLLIVLSGPSGVGKGTIVNRLLQSGSYALSVSCTTRAPREREVDGESYFFITKQEFGKMVEQNGFLEYSNHLKNFYGTPKKFVEEKLKTQDVILEIEVDGALNVKKAHPEALLIMILPPDEEALCARLRGRGTETEEQIRERVERMKYELSKKHLYDYTVINDDLNVAVSEIEEIIKKEKEQN